MPHETRALAKYVANLAYEDIPERVLMRALDVLVDQIGSEIGCSELPWARQVRDAYGRAGGAAEATVVRYGDRLPVAAAAFINSTFGHSFEYDDGNPRFLGHPGTELIPALIAISEREHVSGRDFLTAFIAAYEARGRIGSAVVDDIRKRGGAQFSTACGPFGVAAGAARLLGLGEEGIHAAMGIAGTFSGGLMQYDHGGGSVKRIYSAAAGSGGIQSAYLAQAGITGPEEILEGPRGLLRIYSASFLPECLVAGFNETWMFDTVYFKPYCCVGIIAGAIDAFSRIIAHQQLKADDIVSVEAGYPTGFHAHAAIAVPRDLLGMQFSTSYSLAITMLKGRNTPCEYTEQMLNDEAVRAFAAKVRVVEELELNNVTESRMPARVRVTTVSGKTFEETAIHPRGSPGAPFSSGDVDSKFRSQTLDAFGAQGSERVLTAVRNIAALDDMASLLPMLVVSNQR